MKYFLTAIIGLASCAGPKGDKGDKGEASKVAGPKGEDGSDGLDGKDGSDGENGSDGADGQDGVSCVTYPIYGGVRIKCEDSETFISCGKSGYSLTASRTYSPSTWSNGDFSLPENVALKLQSELFVNKGNAGKGWLSVGLPNGDKLCYQGQAPNNTTTSNKFRFKYRKLLNTESTECFDMSGTVDSLMDSLGEFNLSYGSLVNYYQGDVFSLQINGGGCSNLCAETEVTLGLSK